MWKLGRKMRRLMMVVALVFMVGMGVAKWQNKKTEETRPARAKRMITPTQLLTRIDHLDTMWRLRSAVDVVPGGYAAAMAPVMVDWEASEPQADDGFFVIHNLNHGGNPVDGTTVLGSAKIPFRGLKSVEFTLLPLDKIKKEGLIQHGQLRFVFSDEHPIELLDFGGQDIPGQTVGGNAHCHHPARDREFFKYRDPIAVER